jgi:hypothetical protein
MAKAVEGFFGILSHGQNLAPFGLDTNRVPKKQPLLLPPGKRMEKNIGCCRRYPRFVGLKYSKSKTEGQGSPAAPDMGNHLSYPLPALQATVGLDRLI